MRYFFFALSLIWTGADLHAQGITFFAGTWQEALEEAKRQDKIIFVDAYAVWCGPCKRMSSEVFPQEKVGAFYNRHFINVKLDMEKGEGLTFRQRYPVSAFPTLFYIDHDGEVVHKVKGARGADEFIEVGRAALSRIDRSQQYAEAYEKGDRDPELVFNYVKALNKAGKSSLRIANEYLRDQQDLSAPQNLRFILEAAAEADSRIFDLMIQHRAKISALTSEQTVQERIRHACRATVEKAIEYQSAALLEEATGKMKKHHPVGAQDFTLRAEMDFALASADAKSYLKAGALFARKVENGSPEALNALARNLMLHFKEDAKAMEQAERLAAEAAKKGDSFIFHLSHAQILAANGKKDKAIQAANKALRLAEEEGESATYQVKRFLQLFES